MAYSQEYKRELQGSKPSYVGGLSCILLCLSLILFIVAYSSPFWFDGRVTGRSPAYHLGLWTACYLKDSSPEVAEDNQTEVADPTWTCLGSQRWINIQGFQSDWMAGVEAVSTISFIFHCFSTIAIVFYVGASSLEKDASKAILFFGTCFTFAAACFTMTALIICGVLVGSDFSAVFRSQLSWSFDVMITSNVFVWISTGLVLGEFFVSIQEAPIDHRSSGARHILQDSRPTSTSNLVDQPSGEWSSYSEFAPATFVSRSQQGGTMRNGDDGGYANANANGGGGYADVNVNSSANRSRGYANANANSRTNGSGGYANASSRPNGSGGYANGNGGEGYANANANSRPNGSDGGYANGNGGEGYANANANSRPNGSGGYANGNGGEGYANANANSIPNGNGGYADVNGSGGHPNGVYEFLD